MAPVLLTEITEPLPNYTKLFFHLLMTTVNLKILSLSRIWVKNAGFLESVLIIFQLVLALKRLCHSSHNCIVSMLSRFSRILPPPLLPSLYYYMRNFCNLIGLEQWYFNLIWNNYMWKLHLLWVVAYFEISLVVYTPNITTNDGISYTNFITNYFF